MEKKITKNDTEWEIFREIWRFYESFAIPEDNDKYWDDLISAGEELARKYDNDTLCVRLVSAIWMTMNDKIKLGKNDG